MTTTPASERISRLRHAIGDGPHAASFNADKHLRAILETLKDKAALELLRKKAA